MKQAYVAIGLFFVLAWLSANNPEELFSRFIFLNLTLIIGYAIYQHRRRVLHPYQHRRQLNLARHIHRGNECSEYQRKCRKRTNSNHTLTTNYHA